MSTFTSGASCFVLVLLCETSHCLPSYHHRDFELLLQELLVFDKWISA